MIMPTPTLTKAPCHAYARRLCRDVMLGLPTHLHAVVQAPPARTLVTARPSGSPYLDMGVRQTTLMRP